MIYPSEAMLSRFREPGRCEYCGLYAPRREPHHLWARGRGNAYRFDIPINLVSLDRICHALAEAAGKPVRSMLIEKVARREGLAAGHIGKQMARLRRTPPAPETQLCLLCYGSCFMPKPSLELCRCCEGGGVLDRFGAPWVEPARTFH